MAERRLTAEERKRAIIEAALPLFAERGFSETTTRDIAKAAGISEPLLYKHFPSKERLYEEILNHSCREIDPLSGKLDELEPSTSTLVHLVYFLMRIFILRQPDGPIPWQVRFRLMANSLLEDGAYARVVHQRRFAPFCSRIEACLKAAIAAGDVLPGPVRNGSAACFTHHLGAWIAFTCLPAKPVFKYGGNSDKLLEECVWFSLRGMGMRDEAIRTYFNPKSLALFFGKAG